jgi:holin-like protein
MKIFRETILIIGIYILGEFISKSFSLPIPGNILGMIILLILLLTNIIKVEKIENISNFFLDHLSIFFIPSGVGLITSFTSIRNNFLAIILICLITTVLVIAATGRIVQAVMRLKNKFRKDIN